MKKNSDYVIVISIMLIGVVLLFIIRDLAWMFYIALLFGFMLGVISIPLFILMNYFAYKSAGRGNAVLCMILSVFGGWLGGFIGAKSAGDDFTVKREMGYLFIVGVFIYAVYPLLSLCLFEFDYYTMLI
ncbi:MAG: hypothetical protein IJ446_00525 [Oscillospiraceae bacterium]|nr:hypothetical protein [Oscillospiraceae bacterium]